MQIDKYEVPLTSDNALQIMEPYDVIIDGTDNFPTRYLVNDACVKLGKPNVYGSILRFEGQLSVFYAKEGPCYRCMFPEPPPPGLVPSCAEAGVLGVLPGTIGTMQATEAIKLITGIGEPMIGRMLLYDALEMSFTTIKVRKNPNCPVCGIPHDQVRVDRLRAVLRRPGARSRPGRSEAATTVTSTRRTSRSRRSTRWRSSSASTAATTCSSSTCATRKNGRSPRWTTSRR